MTNKANLRIGSLKLHEMARVLVLIMVTAVGASTSMSEVALSNVTRYATGDYFSLVGSDCGPTRCMELTHGTSLTAMGPDINDCRCQCRKDTPAFREDRGSCVNHIDECLMATFGRGTTKPQIPFVYLPMKGQIVYPSKEINFSDVEDAICAVTSAQYLSPTGWVTLRDLIDNDVPFGLYRDEGSTFLQWRGSAALHSRLEGRLVAVHVLCSAAGNSRLSASCAAFRVAGAAQNALLDVRSIPFHAGEIVTSEVPQNQGLSVLESLAIGVCVLLLIFVYAAGIIFYINYKQKQRQNQKDPEQNHPSMPAENASLESRIDMSNVMMKTNPLLKLNGMGGDFFHNESMPDVAEHTQDNLDTSSHNSHVTTQKFQKLNTNVISAMVHSRRKKTLRSSIRTATACENINERMQRRSMSPDALERAPHSELSIVDCSLENNFGGNQQLLSSNGENAYRKKLYFNPVFFETEHLKNPPPAAIEFLTKIREIMSIAKEKMTSKRFMPMLSDIAEEDLYHTIDLGWDFPCTRRGRRFSAISLKQENTRKTAHCGGCPGCDNSARSQKTVALTRSSSCKSCVSDDYKQRIVRKWLDEVPTLSNNSKLIKSVAKVSETSRNMMKKNDSISDSEEVLRDNNNSKLTNATKFAQVHIGVKPNPRGMRNIQNEKPYTRTETKPTITDFIPKEIEIKSQISERKPIIAEVITKENYHNTLQDNIKLDSNFSEKKVMLINKKHIEILKIDNAKDNTIEKISKPIVTTLDMKSSPPNHTSRRIRKKLPPPPPPPISPPETSKLEVEAAPIPPEVKVKMEAVIREIKTCRRVEPTELEDFKTETITPISPKIVIPVLAADSHYFSDDNVLTLSRKKDMFSLKDNFMDFDSIERNYLKKRRFSVACGPELSQKGRFEQNLKLFAEKEKLSTSWRDVRKVVETSNFKEDKNINVSDIFINNYMEPLYDNVQELEKPGPLTIQVRGSPVETRRNYDKDNSDFDPDTLDRRETKKRIEKILLKSAGSFKYKSTSSESESCKKSPTGIVTRKIGNLRQIYEAKAKAQEEKMNFYNRRQSVTYGQDLSAFMRSLKAPDLLRHIDGQKDPKPPIPPYQRKGAELSPKFTIASRNSPPGDRRRISEDRDRFQQYTRLDNLNARRSGRRSARTRSRRTDLRKLYKTEDSGYMSTDSNESKRRARYLMQLRPVKTISEQFPIPNIKAVVTKPLTLQMESDTDDVESLWDGRSESGGESVETDSVFFGNFDDSKEMFAELGLSAFEPHGRVVHAPEQIDSGFMGETNIILSGDSDSEHRSVISITTGHNGRASAASLSNMDDSQYMHTIQC